ncbi:MAG: hypothetical protein K2Y19_07335 [Afipia birgiae]|nr:hypothetical protein [Afipia birgiae]
MSLYSFSMYNSTFNISSINNNNKFSIVWVGTTFRFTIPDGYYSYGDLSNYIAFCMLSNGLYFKQTSSTPVYPITINENAVKYASQINILFIPTQSQAASLGYQIPENANWTWPSQATTPQLILETPQLQTLLGFQGGQSIFPEVLQPTNQSFTSTSLPIVSPTYMILVSCNLVESKYNQVPTIIQQIPFSAKYGDLINFQSPQMQSIPIRDGYYNNITIQLFDQYYSNLQFKDYEMTMTLLIETQDEL